MESRVQSEASSGAEEDGVGEVHRGGLSEVARAIQGLGGVFDVDELLGDEVEGASSRTAFAQVIGGDFVNQLMQVSSVSPIWLLTATHTSVTSISPASHLHSKL
jgi:hypothetical protein